MSQKRILITGAAGFLGSHLCDRFIAEGYEVIGMDNLLTGNLENIKHLFPLPQFHFYHHDVSKFVHIPGELDYILHFASPASPIDYLKIPHFTQSSILTIDCSASLQHIAYNIEKELIYSKKPHIPPPKMKI